MRYTMVSRALFSGNTCRQQFKAPGSGQQIRLEYVKVIDSNRRPPERRSRQKKRSGLGDRGGQRSQFTSVHLNSTRHSLRPPSQVLARSQGLRFTSIHLNSTRSLSDHPSWVGLRIQTSRFILPTEARHGKIIVNNGNDNDNE